MIPRSRGRQKYGTAGGRAKINEKFVRCLPEQFSMPVYNWVHKFGLPVFVGTEQVQPRVIHNQEDSHGNIVRDENANTPRYSIRRAALIEWLISRQQLPEIARRYINLVPSVR
jgi:hypothetical protein